MAAMGLLTVDGSLGEGGGQILRSALALSLCLQQPFRIHHIRSARRRPGLMPQHLAAVRAATAVGRAQVEGAEPGSGELVFRPRVCRGGHYRFDIGSAGSTTLVVQTVLPALLTAAEPARLELIGGTHNPLAPPFEFLDRAFVPLINRMGPRVTLALERYGFYPVGGGRLTVEVTPTASLRPLNLIDAGSLVGMDAEALVSRLPLPIADRELALIGEAFDMPADALKARQVESPGPGNAVMLTIRREAVTEVFSGIGQRGKRAEQVAREVVAEARRFLQAGVPVGEHLADQLLLPLALAGGGCFHTLAPSGHTLTNIEVIRLFTGSAVRAERQAGTDRWAVVCP